MTKNSKWKWAAYIWVCSVPLILIMLSINNSLDFVLKIAPLGVWAGAAVALFNYSAQSKQARFKMEIELILKMNERFDSKEMRQFRVKASTSLKNDGGDADASIDNVLYFFEELCYLFENDAVNLESLEKFFQYWIAGYYWAAKEYRKEQQTIQHDLEAYDGIEKLFDSLRAFENMKNPESGHMNRMSDQDELESFLDSEMSCDG